MHKYGHYFKSKHIGSGELSGIAVTIMQGTPACHSCALRTASCHSCAACATSGQTCALFSFKLRHPRSCYLTYRPLILAGVCDSIVFTRHTYTWYLWRVLSKAKQLGSRIAGGELLVWERWLDCCSLSDAATTAACQCSCLAGGGHWLLAIVTSVILHS